MVRKLLHISLLLFIVGCGAAKKKTTYNKERKVTVEPSAEGIATNGETLPNNTIGTMPVKADKIINTALAFSGVRYKYGGTTRKGMDCSGLLYVSFLEHNIPLPRISHEMADEGKHIRVEDVVKGDLLFFKTSRKGKRINHVGLVVAVEGDDIKFIHSTSSRGVIVSSLREGFWNYAFVKATRVF